MLSILSLLSIKMFFERKKKLSKNIQKLLLKRKFKYNKPNFRPKHEFLFLNPSSHPLSYYDLITFVV